MASESDSAPQHQQESPQQLQSGWLRVCALRLADLVALDRRLAALRQTVRGHLSQWEARLAPVRTRLSASVPRRRMHVPKRAERQIRRFGPLLLIVSLVVYVVLGAAAFLFFEHTNHEQTVRKWFFNLIVNRHKFARQISSAIFNGTRNMLVIVDYDSSERIQRDLVHLLSQYEHQLSLRMPDLNEWTLENSLTYAWGLLTTIGHGHRAPKTRGGQIFALFYCLLGVPFFVMTLIVVSHRLFELCRSGFRLVASKRRRRLSNHHLMLLLFVLTVYVLWLLLFAAVLFLGAISESYWRSLHTAVLSSLTIQSADYNALDEMQKLLTLAGSTVSLFLACVGILSLTGVYRYGRGSGICVANGEDSAEGGKERKRASIKSAAAKATSTQASESSVTPQQTPKFQVIVDEAGETKLASSASSPTGTEHSSSGTGGRCKRIEQ